MSDDLLAVANAAGVTRIHAHRPDAKGMISEPCGACRHAHHVMWPEVQIILTDNANTARWRCPTKQVDLHTLIAWETAIIGIAAGASPLDGHDYSSILTPGGAA